MRPVFLMGQARTACEAQGSGLQGRVASSLYLESGVLQSAAGMSDTRI
jgi:hypothetical protein